MENYRTIMHQGFSEIELKKSKFFGYSFPVSSEEQANEIIREIKKKERLARHHVFAYRLKNNILKQSDDGEPSGTAGKPILDILINEDILDCLIVVVRYFGGTLLGTGGLVKCYQGAGKEALVDGEIIERALYKNYMITINYNLGGKLEYFFQNIPSQILNTIYSDNISYNMLIKADFLFQDELNNITNGTAEIEFIEDRYCTTINGEIEVGGI